MAWWKREQAAVIGVRPNGSVKISSEVSSSGRHATLPFHTHSQYASKVFVWGLGAALAAAICAGGWELVTWTLDTKAAALEAVEQTKFTAHEAAHKALDDRIEYQRTVLLDEHEDVRQIKDALRTHLNAIHSEAAAAKLQPEKLLTDGGRP